MVQIIYSSALVSLQQSKLKTIFFNQKKLATRGAKRGVKRVKRSGEQIKTKGKAKRGAKRVGEQTIIAFIC